MSKSSFSDVRCEPDPLKQAELLMLHNDEGHFREKAQKSTIYTAVGLSKDQVHRSKMAKLQNRIPMQNGRPKNLLPAEEAEILVRLEEKLQNRECITVQVALAVMEDVCFNLMNTTGRVVPLEISRSSIIRFLKKNEFMGNSFADIIEKNKKPPRQVYEKWFDLLAHELDGQIYAGDRIFNMDESQISWTDGILQETVYTKDEFFPKYVTYSPETHVTMIGCVSADGQSLPPAFIGVKEQLDVAPFEEKAVVVPRYYFSKSGYINGDLLIRWAQDIFLVEVKKGGNDSPVLLFLDGHKSRLNKDFRELMKINGIKVIIIPPGYTQYFQPLDMAIFAKFKSKLKRELKDKTLEGAIIAGKYAWGDSATMTIIRSGWVHSRIFFASLEDFLKERVFGPEKVYKRPPEFPGGQVLV